MFGVGLTKEIGKSGFCSERHFGGEMHGFGFWRKTCSLCHFRITHTAPCHVLSWVDVEHHLRPHRNVIPCAVPMEKGRLDLGLNV